MKTKKNEITTDAKMDAVDESAENLKDEVTRLEKRSERLRKAIAEEREKVAGYEQIAKVHSAYISILLKKLGATKDNMLTITASEVKEAIEKYEARAMPAEDGFSLYCENIGGSDFEKLCEE